MRKSLISTCLTILAMIISSYPLYWNTAYAEEYITISELHSQTADRWSDSFANNSGEIIWVDCPIEVPNVEKAPILSATWYPALSDGFLEEYASSKSAWPMTDARSGEKNTMLVHDYHYALQESEIRLKYYDMEQFIKLEDIDWNAVYARNSTLTAAQAFNVIYQKVKEVYSKYGEYGFYDLKPARGLTILSLVNKEGENVRELDVYSFCGQQVIRGIPIVTHAGYTFASSEIYPDTMYQYEGGSEAQYYVLHVETEDSYGFAANLLTEKEVLADDIPFLSFDSAKQDIIALIEEGYIRDIYGIQFGFAAYPDKQHDLKNYILIPSWVIECEYYDSPNSITESVTVPNYSNSQHYRRLVVNAQTGKILDPRSKAPDRSDAPHIITWSQIK